MTVDVCRSFTRFARSPIWYIYKRSIRLTAGSRVEKIIHLNAATSPATEQQDQSRHFLPTKESGKSSTEKENFKTHQTVRRRQARVSLALLCVKGMYLYYFGIGCICLLSINSFVQTYEADILGVVTNSRLKQLLCHGKFGQASQAFIHPIEVWNSCRPAKLVGRKARFAVVPDANRVRLCATAGSFDVECNYFPFINGPNEFVLKHGC